MKEIWKPVIGYEGIYEVSNQGEVRNFKTKKLKKQKSNYCGYLSVTLKKERKSKTI